MKKVLLLCLFFALLGCREEPVQKEIPDDSQALNQQIKIDTTRKVNLLPKAREKIGSWLAYATAKNQIEILKTATGNEIIQASQPLVQIMEALEETIPDSLVSNAVNARLKVLLTKAKVLRQQSQKKHKNAEEIFAATQTIITGFENFQIQLNEIFVKAPEDFEAELDSIFQANITLDSLSSDSL